MTRAEWIQRYMLDACRSGEWDGVETVNDANHVADALERSKAAPWDSKYRQTNTWNAGSLSQLSAQQLETVANQICEAEKAEREACAKIADRNDQNAWGIAKEIRARSTT